MNSFVSIFYFNPVYQNLRPKSNALLLWNSKTKRRNSDSWLINTRKKLCEWIFFSRYRINRKLRQSREVSGMIGILCWYQKDFSLLPIFWGRPTAWINHFIHFVDKILKISIRFLSVWNLIDHSHGRPFGAFRYIILLEYKYYT